MPQSLIPFYDPDTRRPIPVEILVPHSSADLSDQGNWGGVAVDRRRHRGTWEEPVDFTTPGVRLHVPLTTANVEHCLNGVWRPVPIVPGHVDIIPAEAVVRHRWMEADFSILDLHLDETLLSRVVSGARREIRLLSSAPDLQIARFALLMADELAAGCPSGRLFGEHLASALAVHLLTHYAVHPINLKEYQRGLGKSDLSRVLTYIGDRLADDLSLEDLAVCCHLSTYHFSRLFKQSTGQSPHQYVIAQRVEKAKTLLLRGRLTAGEVAQAVGFYDQAHLIRHFKKQAGTTPGRFREGR